MAVTQASGTLFQCRVIKLYILIVDVNGKTGFLKGVHSLGVLFRSELNASRLKRGCLSPFASRKFFFFFYDLVSIHVLLSM